MKKRSIIILFILCALYLYFNYVNGRFVFRKNMDTPEDFLNHTIIDREGYSKDSAEIIRQLKKQLLAREDFFHNSAYFDSTQLLADSIVYSPDLKKLAVFVITRNPTYRQLTPNEKSNWYYDATCYLGIKKNDTTLLSWIGPNYSNAYNRESISKDIRDACFRTFVIKDTSRTNLYTYNLNDIRFWDSPIWKAVQEKREKKDCLNWRRLIIRKMFMSRKSRARSNCQRSSIHRLVCLN